MTEWKTLAAKFTSEEIEIIKPFQKMLGLSDSKFVKISVLSMMFVFGSFMKLAESEETKKINKKYQNLRKEVSKHPGLKNVELAVQEMTNSWEQAINQIIKENEPKIKKFTKKRKIGRPKSRKKNRGRPKDIGI